MSVDTNNTELKKGADLATIADQRDDQRQQAEAEAAQEVLQRMQDTAAEDEKRRAHEEAEAKRKAEWEQKQREKAEAEQAAWENAVAMGDDEVMMASMKRVGDDAERLTRRNMKQCVTEHIQTKCLSEPEFARQVMHPRKNMIRCFRYITRKAKEFVEQEMKDNDEKPIAGGYGCDVPDDMCYLWAEEYFMDMDAEEDKEKEEKFVPKPYDSISYSRTCGRTGHHFKDGLAFKFEDELFETRLDHIEWTPTRSGEISPVAVFDTIEIDGCEVSRATLHNLSFIEGLELMPGNRILVSKRNMIIPQVEENLDRGDFSMEALVPSLCPCCGYQTIIHTTQKRIYGELKLTKTLFCHNPNCASQNLRKFVHFVGKKAMDIEGLSEVTLEQFIARGWLQDFTDIYRLDNHREEIIRMDGFGERSWQRLWDAIQKSRNTSFERYLIAMDIPMIGNTASAALGRCFDQSLRTFEVAVDTGYDFTQLPDFGETLHNNIHEWFSVEENRILWEELKPMVNTEKKETTMSVVQDNPFVGKTLVVTGKVEPYTRDGINAKIYSLGAKAGSSVSKNTDYLICGENAGSKLVKAQALGVAVLSPAEFFRMIGE